MKSQLNCLLLRILSTFFCFLIADFWFIAFRAPTHNSDFEFLFWHLCIFFFLVWSATIHESIMLTDFTALSCWALRFFKDCSHWLRWKMKIKVRKEIYWTSFLEKGKHTLKDFSFIVPRSYPHCWVGWCMILARQGYGFASVSWALSFVMAAHHLSLPVVTRSNMMSGDQSFPLLCLEKQLHMYVSLTIVPVVSIYWAFTDVGLVALMFAFGRSD